jgi:phage-related protein
MYQVGAMPAAKICIYRADDGSAPFLDWLREIERRNRKVYEKCRSYVRRLAEQGHELRRPTADLLRDGVYELRFNMLGVNYLVLYGFVGKDLVMISHGITKKGKVPPAEIDKAAERLAKYKRNPEKYGMKEADGHG